MVDHDPTIPDVVQPSKSAMKWLPMQLTPWVISCIAVPLATAYGLHSRALSSNAASLEKELFLARSRVLELTRTQSAAEVQAQQLADDRQKLSGDLKVTTEQMEATRSELERTQSELTEKLQSEIKEGEIIVRKRGDDLIVDVSDKVLFDTGKAEISERGMKLLRQVAVPLLRTKGPTFQVGGHTDAARVSSPDVRARFPTNWELSATRATNVVRFLQEKCHVPGNRLVAAGYAEYRPVASNASEEGRRKNRRIEFALVLEPAAR